ETPITGALRLGELSALETISQARSCIPKVVEANGHLYRRRVEIQRDVPVKKDAYDLDKGPTQAEKDLAQTDGYLARNEQVIATLQDIIDLGEGNSLVDSKGNRPGHDTRIGVFTQLAQAAMNDFARLQ